MSSFNECKLSSDEPEKMTQQQQQYTNGDTMVDDTTFVTTTTTPTTTTTTSEVVIPVIPVHVTKVTTIMSNTNDHKRPPESFHGVNDDGDDGIEEAMTLSSENIMNAELTTSTNTNTATKDVQHSNENENASKEFPEENRSSKKQKSTHHNNDDAVESHDDDNRHGNNSTSDDHIFNVTKRGTSSEVTSTTTTDPQDDWGDDTTTIATPQPKLLASSVQEYLKQARNHRNNHRNNISPSLNHGGTVMDNTDVASLSSTSSSFVKMAYLPRPEWCATTYHGMLLHIQDKSLADLKTFISMLLRIGLGEENEYLKQFATSKECNKDTKNGNTQDVPSPEQIDSMKRLLTSNIIYFDTPTYRWNTKQIECDSEIATSTTTTTTTIITTAIPVLDATTNSSSSSSSPLDHPHRQMTYESIIEQRHFPFQTFGKDHDSILHMAIKENATPAALDIVRIEYNTYLYTHAGRKPLGATKNPLDQTLLVAKNEKGVTPFILAAQKGNIQVVKQLLNCGVSILEKSNNGSTATLQAAHFGHVKVIEYIIKYYQLNHDKKRLTTPPLFWPETVVELIDKPNVNATTPLMRAAQEGHLSTAKLLLKYAPSAVLSRNSFQMTPLMLAAQRGHAPMCHFLIRQAAYINAKTNQNSTALLLACKRGHVDVVKELVTAGCELHHTDNRNRTAQQVIQQRIQQHHETRWVAEQAVVPNPPRRRHNHRRRHRRNHHGNDDQQLDGNDDDRDEGGDNDEDDNLVSLRTDEAILQMLHPQSQLQLMQLSLRAQRSFELIRFYTLFHSNRAEIKFWDYNNYFDLATFDLADVTRWQTETMMATSTNDMEQHHTPSVALSLEHPPRQLPEPTDLPSVVPLRLAHKSTKALIRTMLLPASLMQTIALFLPLPNLWDQRICRLESWTCQNNPNEAIVYALDIIDEVLEEAGLLVALDAANIKAPDTHQSWQKWKQSAISNTVQTNGRRNLSYDSSDAEGQRDITESVAPRPRDEKHPTICELRRRANYLPLLSKNEGTDSNIVPMLLEEPYRIPSVILTRLLVLADVASICRRCCLESDLATLRDLEPHNNAVISHVVQFEPVAASDIVSLTSRLCRWHNKRERNKGIALMQSNS